MGAPHHRTGGRAPLWACLVLLVAAGSTYALPQQSPSYVMERVTLSSAALEASSASFVIRVTPGQEGPVGSVSVCNAGAFQSTGFWSIAGDPPVPILLSARQDPGDPAAVELAWTGSAGLFELFRSDMADTVADPDSSLTTTSLCGVTDAPLASDITYYLVLPAGN